MASLWTFILIGSVIYLFWLNRKVAEAANVHAKRQSEQLQVQLMSVACTKRRFGFLKNGKPGIKCEFIFANDQILSKTLGILYSIAKSTR
jgi:hypothetical protein